MNYGTPSIIWTVVSSTLSMTMVLGSLGNMVVHNVYTMPDDRLCVVVNASVLRSNWKSVRAHCQSDAGRDKMDGVAAGLSDDSNPVLFKWRLKK